jgi:hypothetical protein
MITGMGIPNSQSIRLLPIFRFPTLFPKKMQQHNDDKNGIFYSAAATIVSLHLAVANEMGAPSVPVGKEEVRREDNAF